MLHKYYVVVENPCDKNGVHADLIANYSDEAIPGRCVDILNPMHHSEYNFTVTLTQDEAEALMSDLRVREVHRDPVNPSR